MYKLIFMLALCTIGCIISVPVGFQRLALVQNDKILKTVDLIYEGHFPYHEVVKNPSRNKPYLQEVEKKYFTTSERTLLITLRELAANGEKINLFWEFSPQEEDLGYNTGFIRYSSTQLKKDFEHHPNISFYSISSYRALLRPYTESIAYNDPSRAQHLFLTSFYNDLQDFINKQVSARDDLNLVRKQAPQYYSLALTLWNNYHVSIDRILEKIIEPVIQKNENSSVSDFLRSISAPDFDMVFDAIIGKSVDYEAFIKILGSSASHDIMYAGAHHTQQVGRLLEEKTKFVSLIDINTAIPRGAKFVYPLTHRAWNFLKEPAEKSLTRYKQAQNKTLTLDYAGLKKQFEDIFNELQLSPFKNKQQQLEYIEKTLKPFFEQANKSYVNFLEVRERSTYQTILFIAVQKKLSFVVEYLVSIGARVNALDKDLRTPLHYAAMLPISTIFKTLFNNGGDITLQDRAGKTPVQYAKWSGLPDIIKKKSEMKKETEMLKEQ